LQDEDVGVAEQAEAALVVLGQPQAALQAQLPQLLSREHPCGAALAGLAGSEDPVLRMRALTLAVRLMAGSPQAAAALRASGLLEPLLEELRDPGGLQGWLRCSSAATSNTWLGSCRFRPCCFRSRAVTVTSSFPYPFFHRR
jgi:hypothetical protein